MIGQNQAIQFCWPDKRRRCCRDSISYIDGPRRAVVIGDAKNVDVGDRDPRSLRHPLPKQIVRALVVTLRPTPRLHSRNELLGGNT